MVRIIWICQRVPPIANYLESYTETPVKVVLTSFMAQNAGVRFKTNSVFIGLPITDRTALWMEAVLHQI